MIQGWHNSKIRSSISGILLLLFLCSICIAAESDVRLPELKAQASPLDETNRSGLLKRLVAAFDREYATHVRKNKSKNLSDNMAVYYLRHDRVIKAMADAKSNQRPLLRHNRPRGTWPCFFLEKVEQQTGGHNQLCDFQGAAGFLMVADVLNQAGKDGWKDIADFVEKNIVEKWLFYPPSIKPEHFQGPRSNTCRIKHRPGYT